MAMGAGEVVPMAAGIAVPCTASAATTAVAGFEAGGLMRATIAAAAAAAAAARRWRAAWDWAGARQQLDPERLQRPRCRWDGQRGTAGWVPSVIWVTAPFCKVPSFVGGRGR